MSRSIKKGPFIEPRLLGRIVGHTTPWRKAIVTLAPGQKIEFFEGV